MLFDKMKIEMDRQTKTITNNLLEKMDEKLQPLLEENRKLKEKVEILEKKIYKLENEKKRNNILLFRLEETEKSSLDLLRAVKEIIKNDLNISIDSSDIQNIHRIGNKKDERTRPLLISFTNYWKKAEILKNKKNLRDVYIVEDYPKAVLEKRKLLQQQLKEERAKGNFAYIKYDRLIIKEDNATIERRKREQSTSPGIYTNPKKQVNLSSNTKTKSMNAYDLLRARSNSFSSLTSNNKTN